jgi:hypothetical protein
VVFRHHFRPRLPLLFALACHHFRARISRIFPFFFARIFAFFFAGILALPYP